MNAGEVKMKLLFFDIDGTLIDESTKEVPKSTKLALEKAKANGHLLFINTGRPYSAIPKVIKDLNVDGYICGCGSYICYHNEVLLHTPLTNFTSKQIVQIVQRTQVDAVLEGAHAIYYDVNTTNPILLDMQQDFIKEGYEVRDIHDPNIIFDKLTAYTQQSPYEDLFIAMMSHYFSIIVRGPHFYECIQKPFTKATGIGFLMDYLKVGIEDVYAFGDSSNDLSMLRATKHSVAMGNSPDDLKTQVSYVTDDVSADGVQKALIHLGIIV